MSRRCNRIGIIGGGMTRGMYSPGLKVLDERGMNLLTCVAVADREETHRQAMLRDLNAEESFREASDLIVHASDLGLDAVIIATPTMVHLEHVQQAAQAGLHILLEKPMARTVEEARSMTEACDAAGVMMVLAFNRRFHPVLYTARRMIQEGDLGEVFHVECIWTSWTAGADCGWRDAAETLGGTFQDHASHTVDQSVLWLGKASAVYAQALNIGPALGVGRKVEDHMTAMITHEQGTTSLHAHSRACHRPITESYRIFGTRGTLECEYCGDWSYLADDPWRFELFREGRPGTRIAPTRLPDVPDCDLGDGAYSYYAELYDFASQLKQKRSTQTNEDNLHIVQSVSASYLSALRNLPQSVEDAKDFDEGSFSALGRKMQAVTEPLAERKGA